ncbi:MAG: hypothetical protein LBD05_02115 [Mycoplasmataceae bacterium]|nr:hypothetical protein [Mycoplasmataceae bacterium]
MFNTNQYNEITDSRIKNSSVFDDKKLSYQSQAMQITYKDNADIDTSFDDVYKKTIDFNTKIKKVFLSNANASVKSNFFIKELTQETNYDIVDNYGSYSNHDGDYDLCKRTQNWTNMLCDNLSLAISNDKTINTWGWHKGDYFLNNTMVWKKNTNQDGIIAPTMFEKNGEKGYIFKDGEQIIFNMGSDRNFNNTSYDVYGLPFTFLKESSGSILIWNWVDRYLYTLNNDNNMHNEKLINIKSRIEGWNDFFERKIETSTYSLNNLLSIDNSSCKGNEKYIEFGINNNLSKMVHDLNEWYNFKKTLNKENTLDSLLIDMLEKYYYPNMLLDKETLSIIQEIYDKIPIKTGAGCLLYYAGLAITIKDYLKTIEDEMHKKYCEQTEIYQIGLNILDTFNFILENSNINIECEISDPKNPHKTINKIINFKNNKKLFLNPNENNEYKFKIKNIVSEEINNDDYYIQGSSTKNIKLNIKNIIETDDGFIKLVNSKIEHINYKDPSYEYNNYLSFYTDEEIVDDNVILFDEKYEVYKYNDVDHDNIKVIRDEINANAIIRINLNGTIFDKIVDGFKKPNKTIEDIDCQIIRKQINPCDINNSLINECLVENGYDNMLTSVLVYSIENIDCISGEAKIKVINDENDIYTNQIFKIKNMLPYFISKKEDMPNNILNLKPSSITTNIFKNEFLNISDDFANKNELNINLFSDDNKNNLIAKINYIDFYTHKEINLQYYYSFNEEIKINTIIIAIVSTSFIIFALIITYFIFIKKKN